MKILSIVIMLVIAVCIAFAFIKVSNCVNEKGAAWILRIVGVSLALFVLSIGVLDAFDKLEAKYNVTLKYIDTGTTVYYENARISYNSHGQKTLFTETGQRIAITNAEVYLDPVKP